MLEGEKQEREEPTPEGQAPSSSVGVSRLDSEDSGGSKSPTEDRRGFLGLVTAGLAAGVSAAVASPLLVAVAAPFRGDKHESTALVDLGPVKRFGPAPVKVVVRASREDAWTRSESEVIGTVYVLREAGGRVRAWSAVCPHASCNVSWEPGSARYFCPCHASAFGLDGAVTGGPSPRALDELIVELREHRAFVKFERFRPGQGEKVPV